MALLFCCCNYVMQRFTTVKMKCFLSYIYFIYIYNIPCLTTKFAIHQWMVV